MNERIKDILIPDELADKIERETYRLWRKGADVEEAKKATVRLFIAYWKERYADKSGG